MNKTRLLAALFVLLALGAMTIARVGPSDAQVIITPYGCACL